MDLRLQEHGHGRPRVRFDLHAKASGCRNVDWPKPVAHGKGPAVLFRIEKHLNQLRPRDLMDSVKVFKVFDAGQGKRPPGALEIREESCELQSMLRAVFIIIFENTRFRDGVVLRKGLLSLRFASGALSVV